MSAKLQKCVIRGSPSWQRTLALKDAATGRLQSAMRHTSISHHDVQQATQSNECTEAPSRNATRMLHCREPVIHRRAVNRIRASKLSERHVKERHIKSPLRTPHLPRCFHTARADVIRSRPCSRLNPHQAVPSRRPFKLLETQ